LKACWSAVNSGRHYSLWSFALCGVAFLMTCVTNRAGAAEATPKQVSEPEFAIEAIDVDGNSLLDERALDAAIYPHMGPKRTRDDVLAAQKDLQDAYRSRGYQSVIVEIPPQTVRDGVIKLHVVEEPIGHLRVVGSKYHSLVKVREAVPSLQEGKVANFGEVETQIAEANRLPDRQVTPIIHAGTVPGTLDVDLQVADQEPVHASVEINNDNSPSTDPLRLNFNLRYDNLWQLGHTISATYAVAPQDRSQSEVYAGSYVAPIWNTPLTFLLYGYNSNSDLATIGAVDVLGKGFAIGSRIIYQLSPFGDFTNSFSVGVDFKHFFEFIQVNAGDFGCANGTSTMNTSCGAVDYFPLYASYTIRRQTESTSSATFSFTSNFRGIGANDAGFQTKRANAQANFIHANIDLDHIQPWWLGFETDTRLAGQATNTPLVSSEQLSAGGVSSVRGYLESEAVGDEGLTGSFELRSPVLLKGFANILDNWRFYSFYDAGRLWVLKPQADQTKRFFLESTGVGTRFDLMNHIHSDVDVAFPLRDGPTRFEGHPYINFSVKAEY
jgi:hemolysin activation/secretion protein